MYRIVIADDEKLICDAILAVLNSAIPEMKSVKVFHNGKEAYDYVQTNGADLLLLDIKMPGKSGLDIARHIYEQKLDCYVIIITAYRDFDYAKNAIDYNVNAFLTKPFSSRELINTVRKGLAFFEKKESIQKDRHKAHRHLLQVLRTDDSSSFEDRFHVFKDTVPFTEPPCTEIIIKDDKLATLPLQTRSAMKQLLAEAVEADTANQTSFLIECGDEVCILVFAKDVPSLHFTEDAIRIINCYTGNMSQTDTKTYNSFEAYRT